MAKTKKLIMPFWREFKGTQGPWGIERTETTNWIGPIRERDGKVKTVVTDTDREGLREDALMESDRNAELIAAAPKMHKLLNQFISQGILNKPDQEKVFEITAEAQQLLIDINGE